MGLALFIYYMVLFGLVGDMLQHWYLNIFAQPPPPLPDARSTLPLVYVPA